MKWNKTHEGVELVQDGIELGSGWIGTWFRIEWNSVWGSMEPDVEGMELDRG